VQVWLSWGWSWHRQLIEIQATNNSIEEQETTPFVTEGRRHFMRTSLHFSKESLHHTALSRGGPKFGSNRIEHGMVAITDP
jgi:hypothetical protein